MASDKQGWPEKPVTIPGMPVSVLQLRHKGQKIPVEQLREIEPLVGRLVVELKASGDSRTFRMIAQLRGPGLGDVTDVCWPLFDPVLERQDSRGQILAGYQLDSKDGIQTKYGQAWLVKPLTSSQG